MNEFDVNILSDHTDENGLRKVSVGTCGLVCSSRIDFTIDGEYIRDVRYTGGCNGNLKGISVLADGMKAKELAGKLEGIDCRGRGTSCPDQLARALKALL